MNWLVAAFGVLVFAIGVYGVVEPEGVVRTVRAWGPARRLRVAIGVRLVMGVVFLLAAEACRHPTVITVFGALALLAALLLPLFGSERLDRMIDWWFDRPVGFLRLWFGVGLLFAGFLVWTGLP